MATQKFSGELVYQWLNLPF